MLKPKSPIKIISIVAILAILLLSSCKSCNCPAYSYAHPQTEQDNRT